MPESVLGEVVALRFNDVDGANRRIDAHARNLAAILIDPMPSRAGLIPPEPAFIRAITEAARRHGILIICDEVLNLRQGLRGAAARYQLEPDLFALGKIIGGGLPIGAVGGRTDVMRVFAAGNGRAPVPQGGTFAANPLAMSAGLAAIRALDEPQFAHLDALGEELRAGMRGVIEKAGAPLSIRKWRPRSLVTASRSSLRKVCRAQSFSPPKRSGSARSPIARRTWAVRWPTAIARRSNRIAVVAAQNGPAATLLVPPLAEALKASIPIVALVQEVERPQFDRNAFQELDHLSLFQSCSKWVRRLATADRVDDYVDAAFVAAGSGRPGPAVLLLPADLLREAAAESPFVRRTRYMHWPIDRFRPGDAAIDAAADLIAQARAPIVFAGGGVLSSGAAPTLARASTRTARTRGGRFRHRRASFTSTSIRARSAGTTRPCDWWAICGRL